MADPTGSTTLLSWPEAFAVVGISATLFTFFHRFLKDSLERKKSNSRAEDKVDQQEREKIEREANINTQISELSYQIDSLTKQFDILRQSHQRLDKKSAQDVQRLEEKIEKLIDLLVDHLDSRNK